MTNKLQAIENDLEELGYVGVFWHIDDVKEVRPDLDAGQCWHVLERMHNKHDCTIGINWDVLSITADILYPQPTDEGMEGGEA